MARKKDTSTIVVILTGDTRRFAEAIARKLGIDWVRAKLAREEKSQRLRICRRRPEDRYGGRWGQRRCALAQADAGMAIGAAGLRCGAACTT